jgi:hypothetical protein
VKVWDHFKEAEKPIPAGGVTYNFSLSPDTHQRERDIAKLLDWGADVVTLAESSGDFEMCTGTADTCPTPKLNVAKRLHDELQAKGEAAVSGFQQWVGGNAPMPDDLKDLETRMRRDLPDDFRWFRYVEDGVPPERWNHDCDGILGQFAGHELFWMACTGVVGTPDVQELPSLESAHASGPGVPDYSEAEPNDEWLAEIKQLNSKNLQEAASGNGKAALAVGGQVVLIGAKQDAYPGDYVRAQADRAEGLLNTKSPFGKGSSPRVRYPARETNTGRVCHHRSESRTQRSGRDPGEGDV